MKTLVIYYSYSGHTCVLAENKAQQASADLYEIEPLKKRNILSAYTAGALGAIRGATQPIKPIDINLDAYDTIIIMSPVWAGKPAPPINNLFQILPYGKNIEVYMVSASGDSNCKDTLEAKIKARKCFLNRFENIKA